MKKLSLLCFLFGFLTGCGSVGTNYQDVKKRAMKTDPCKYERTVGKKREEICKSKVKAGTDGDKRSGLFDNILEGLRGEGALSSTGQNVAVNKWLWNGSIETVKDFPLKIADAFGGVIETDWIQNNDIPNQRCAIKILIKSKELLSNAVSANMMCQSFDGKNWSLNNENLSEANREIENSILNLARKSYLSFSG